MPLYLDLSVGKVPVRARLLRKKQEQEARARVTFVVPYEGHIGCSVLLVPAAKPVRLEDTIIASDLCDLIREEGYEYALKSVDCVASEHSKHMDEKRFLSQVQHTIGPRQTGDCLCKGSRVSFNIGPKPLPSPPALNVMSQGLL